MQTLPEPPKGAANRRLSRFLPAGSRTRPGLARPGAPHHSLFLLAFVLLFLPRAAGAESVTVRHVLDGDTVILADQRQVRLVGLNTPELGKDGRPDEPLAAAARDRLRALIEGRTVRLELEAEQRDRYGRWLAHLRLPDGSGVEETLLKEGLGFAIAIPPNLGQLARHQAAEDAARRARRGVWGQTYYDPREAATLAPADTGFRRVRGRVTHVGRSRKFVYLDLAPRFALRITHADWQRYFGGRPEDWRGRMLEARGWVTESNGRLRLGLGHPAMLRQLP